MSLFSMSLFSLIVELIFGCPEKEHKQVNSIQIQFCLLLTYVSLWLYTLSTTIKNKQ